MLLPTPELLKLNTEESAMDLAAARTDATLVKYFVQHCADALVMENVHFIAAIAQISTDYPAWRPYGRTYKPNREDRKWKFPEVAGIYEQFISPSAKESLNLLGSDRDTITRLYEEQDYATGLIAPKLTAEALQPAVNAVGSHLKDTLRAFRKRVMALQADAKKGVDTLTSKARYATALAAERTHQTGKLRSARTGTFLYIPFCGDKKPLLQVSSVITRRVSADRVKLGKELGLKLEDSKEIMGFFVKQEDGSFKVAGEPSSAAAAAAFKLGLEAHGLGSARVEADTLENIKKLATLSRTERTVAAIKGTTKAATAAMGRKMRGGQATHAKPVMKILHAKPAEGFTDAGAAIAEGMRLLNQQRRGALATKVKTNLVGSTVKQGLDRMTKNGTGKYWACMYEDPTYTGQSLVVREVWIYRGMSAPDQTKDPTPRMKSNLIWFCLVSTREADQAQVRGNLTGGGIL